MLNALLSPVKFVSFEEMKSEDLAAAVSFVAASVPGVAATAPGAAAPASGAAASPNAPGGEGRRLRVALVRDGRPSAAVDALAEGLRARFDLVVLDKVRPDPLASDVSAMASGCDIGSIEAVVGLGGGSVMDSAKALAMLASNGGSLEDYLGPTPARRIERKGRPLVLVPTTAGTGSEATKVGVYTSPSGRKYTLGSPFLQADAALLSGALAASMPPALAASTGFDALSHALESMWNRNATPLSLEASTRAALMVLEAIGPAYDAAVATASGKPVESHNAIALAMLEAASAAGVAFSGTGTALVHALSFVLSEDWHVPHGTACAFTLEDAWRLQRRDPGIAQRLEALASRALPEAPAGKAADLLLGHIVAMKQRMGLPSRFVDLGIAIDRAGIVERFARSFDDPKMANSLPAARPEEIYAMLAEKA